MEVNRKGILAVSFALVGLPVGAPFDADDTPLPSGALARLGSLRLHHENWISTVCFHPDGKTIASAGSDIRIWNAADGKLLLRIPSADTYKVAFSPDGLTIAGGVGPDVCFWDLQTGRELRRLKGNGGRIYALAFASDGKSLVCSDDDVLYRWDLRTSKCSHRRSYFADNPLRTFGVRYKDKEVSLKSLAPDGNTAVWFVRHWKEEAHGASSRGGHLDVWDWPAGKVRSIIASDNPNDPYIVALSPDGRFMTYASNGYKAVTIWDTTTGKPIKTLDKGSRIETITFSADGRGVATVLDGQGLVVWDVATGTECLRQPFHVWFSRFEHLTFSPDGRKLAVTQESGICIWDVDSGKETPLLEGHRQPVIDLAVSQMDGMLISGDSQYRCTWDRRYRQTQRQTVLARSAHVNSLALSYPRNLRVIQPKDGPVQLRTLDSDALVGEISDVKGTYWPGSFSTDGRTFALLGEKGTALAVFDVPSRRIRSTIPIERQNDRAFVLTRDGSFAAIVCPGETAKVIDTFTGKVTHRLGDSRDPRPDGDWGRLSLGAFSTDGQWLAFATDIASPCCLGRTPPEKNPRIRVWHMPSGRELRQFQGCLPSATGGTVVGLDFSPDNRCLAVALNFGLVYPRDAASSEVRVLEVASGQQRRLFQGHVGGIRSLVFLPDGKTLATGGEDATILLWDLERPTDKPAAYEGAADRLNRQWRQLAMWDAACAHDAAMAFMARPDEAVPFLAERLKPVEQPSDLQLARWIAELDRNDFRAREAGTEKLGLLGRLARSLLRRTVKSNPSAEARRAIQELLDRLDTPEISLAVLRESRSIEILERMASEEARKVLKRLAAGAPGAPRTVEANAAMARLAASEKRR